MKSTRHDRNFQMSLLGIPLIGEGVAMLVCLWPSAHFSDGNTWCIAASSFLTLMVGVILHLMMKRQLSASDAAVRQPYLMVTLVWIALSLFGALPFMFSRVPLPFTDAFFESMSGLTSTGATILPNVEALPPSLLMWRSMSQWLGGFGIILLVLAVVPKLGLNKYSLYTAEVSSADNMGKTSTSTRAMVQQTLSVYVVLTLCFVVLLMLSGMSLWESVNITFANISTGGFSIYSDSIARFTPLQHYIIAASMFVGGVNFALLYSFFTFKWSRLRHKLDQFGFYVALLLLSALFVVLVFRFHDGLEWPLAVRYGVVQTLSVMTTTGSVIADTNLWWTPVLFLFLVLSFCGGMAGSTTGGIKIMRILILFRNAILTLKKRLHPHAYTPVRLNGAPVSAQIVSNVMVIFIVYVITMLVAMLILLVCGVNATEAVGAVFGCLTGYGPGLGTCGGFGSYAAFPVTAKWICSFLMLLGRLECLTVVILFIPAIWRK